MPSVESMLNTVKDLSLVGSGDATDDARIMRYMNLVYAEMWRAAAKTYETLLAENETVTVTSGTGTMVKVPHYIYSVRDTVNNYRALTKTSYGTIEEQDPDFNSAGTPSHFYMTGTKTLNTWPINSTTARVRFIPAMTELASTDAESSVKVPPEFHDALIFGTLVYMALDERDKATVQEVNLFQSKYDLAMNAYMNWLLFQQSGDELETERTFGD